MATRAGELASISSRGYTVSSRKTTKQGVTDWSCNLTMGWTEAAIRSCAWCVFLVAASVILVVRPDSNAGQTPEASTGSVGQIAGWPSARHHGLPPGIPCSSNHGQRPSVGPRLASSSTQPRFVAVNQVRWLTLSCGFVEVWPAARFPEPDNDVRVFTGKRIVPATANCLAAPTTVQNWPKMFSRHPRLRYDDWRRDGRPSPVRRPTRTNQGLHGSRACPSVRMEGLTVPAP